MLTPTLLPSLPPEGELGLARVRPSLPESLILDCELRSISNTTDPQSC